MGNLKGKTLTNEEDKNTGKCTPCVPNTASDSTLSCVVQL